ncbi:MAG: hypothetical protein U0804_23765 [Gemmataceae bacterium]
MTATATTTTPPIEVSIHDAAETGTKPFKPATQKPPAPDPFDPAKLRLTQSMTAALGVKKLLTTVPVKKPVKEWFVRSHPDAAYRLETFVVELKEDGETYLVAPEFWNALAGESTFSARLLVTAINKQGTVFLWPIRLPSPDGRHDDWSKSSMEAANIAMRGWVRVQSNMSLGAYEVYEASGNLGDPEWPDLPLNELLRIAFKDRYIDSLDHPVLKRLRGEA